MNHNQFLTILNKKINKDCKGLVTIIPESGVGFICIECKEKTFVYNEDDMQNLAIASGLK